MIDNNFVPASPFVSPSVMLLEWWKPVENFQEYQVSFRGELINRRGKRLSPCDKEGYAKYCLYKNGKRKNINAHVLVANHFIGARPNGLCINHKDGNKRNNTPNNLEYISKLANTHHAIHAGLFKATVIRLSVSDVKSIRASENKVPTRILAKRHGVCRQTIRRIQKRILYACIG